MERLTNTFKALSDPTRLRILAALAHQDLCVCELESVLSESQPKISKHLTKLYDLGLVNRSRKGQFIYYRLEKKSEVLNSLMNVISLLALNDDQLKADALNLMHPEQWACNLKERPSR